VTCKPERSLLLTLNILSEERSNEKAIEEFRKSNEVQALKDLEARISQRVVSKLRANSGFVMCPGIVDYDAIAADIRIQTSIVKIEDWPWRHVGAVTCKLWHKPQKQQGMPDNGEDMCGECKLVRRKLLALRDNRKNLDETVRQERQQASSKVRLSILS